MTQKTAWFMLQRIREACGNDNDDDDDHYSCAVSYGAAQGIKKG